MDRPAEIIPGAQRGIQRQSAPIVRARIAASGLDERPAETVMGDSHVRHEPACGSEGIQGLGGTRQSRESPCPRQVDVAAPRCGLDRLVQKLERRLSPATTEFEHAHQMERVCLTRIEAQDAAVHLLGDSASAGLLVGEPHLQQISDRDGHDRHQARQASLKAASTVRA
jgi:hypothetical protein